MLSGANAGPAKEKKGKKTIARSLDLARILSEILLNLETIIQQSGFLTKRFPYSRIIVMVIRIYCCNGNFHWSNFAPSLFGSKPEIN